MSDDVLVKVDNVSKRFCRSLKRSLWYGMQDLGSEIGGRSHGGGSGLPQSSADVQLRQDEFWAVKDVSFELRRGECLGLIGRNGAGKTTLLKMLNGLIKPDSGSIAMNGSVGALIALGAGFNPILSGRENIYTNGSILGLSNQQIDIKINSIIDFADIGEFIDTPVQAYSSGMQVRLGFAIATALHPDILILDEVLAVGDASFRNKCYKRIAELRKSAAIIFVTHQMSHIARVCDSTMVLKQGRGIYLGNVEEGISQYEVLNDNSKIEDSSFLSLSQPIKSFLFSLDSDIINQGDSPRLYIEIWSEVPVDNFAFRFLLYNQSGDICLGSDTSNSDHNIFITKGTNHWNIELDSLFLKRGKYSVAINVMTHTGELLVWSFKQRQIEIKSAHHGPSVDYQPQLKSWISH